MPGKFRRHLCSGMPGIHLSYPEIPQKMPFDLDRLLFQVTGIKHPGHQHASHSQQQSDRSFKKRHNHYHDIQYRYHETEYDQRHQISPAEITIVPQRLKFGRMVFLGYDSPQKRCDQ